MSDTYTTDGRENRVKVGQLVIGLVFIGIAGSWALRASGAIDDLAIGVLIPVVLVLAGVVGLVATVVGSRRRRRVPTPVDQTSPSTLPETAYAEADDQPDPTDQPHPHTEETAPIGSLPLGEPKEPKEQR